MDSKEYYLISPTVNGKTKDIDSFLTKMFQQKIVMMGWSNNDNLGDKFSKIRKGDFVIVAKRHSYVFKYYFAGIIDDDSGNTDEEGYQYRKLKHFVDLRGGSIDYLNGISFYYQQTIKALMRISDPEKIVIMNDIIKKSIEKEHMENIMQLLKANHNLILTGAPGTGKTYLAKQLAKEIVSQKIKETPMNILLSAINNHIIDEKLEQNYKILLTDFKKQFPIENLQKMTLEDYCIGNSDENKNNFCYWMERKLKPLGYYFPGSSRSYLLYWNKSDGEYKVHGYLKQEKNKSNEELMSILASDIYQMVKDNNPWYMAKKYGESFILKILSTYYPDQYAPINSKNHIDNIISLFDIECKSENVFERNKAILGFYQKLTKGKCISPWSFMHILYDNFNIKDGEVLREGIIKNNGEYYLVQFHPSYDYTDFVEGLRPINKEENKDISFVLQDGVFKRLCVSALRNPNKKYVMIIDEINRGEISKIFGELFFSIDHGYRGKKGKVLTQYANMQNNPNEFDLSLNIEESEDYGHFFVPENVYIIGTMNDIDRSVESMDFAFRRRFAFKEITAEESKQMLDSENAWGKDENGNSRKPNQADIDTIKNKMDAINNVIWHKVKEEEKDEDKSIEGLSSAYHIGASYFLKLVNYKNADGSYDYDQLWENHLEGLLLEYMRGMADVQKKIKKLANAYGYSKMNKYE